MRGVGAASPGFSETAEALTGGRAKVPKDFLCDGRRAEVRLESGAEAPHSTSGDAGGREEFILGGDDGLDEGLGCVGAEKGVAIGGVLENFAEGADDGEVVAGVGLGSAEDEHQAHGLISVLEMHSLIAAADGEDDFLDVLGAGVGESDFVAQTGRVEAFAGEELVVETLEISDLGMAVEEPGDFIQGDGAFGALDGERDASGIEELGQTAGHDKKSERGHRLECGRRLRRQLLARAESTLSGKNFPQEIAKRAERKVRWRKECNGAGSVRV